MTTTIQPDSPESTGIYGSDWQRWGSVHYCDSSISICLIRHHHLYYSVQCLPIPTPSPTNITFTVRLTSEHTYSIFGQCPPNPTPLQYNICLGVRLTSTHTY